MDNLVDGMYKYLLENESYVLLPYSRRQIILDGKVAKMDDEIRDFVLELMGEWEFYGFKNGFAYGVKLMMDAHMQ